MFDKEFNAAALAAHNDYRAAHGCPELEIDAKLAEDSQQYAVKLAREGQLKHSECGDYGENLATEGSSGKAELSGQEVSRMWYSEIRSHNFNAEFNKRSGHFTQMIWKSTKKAGFGIAWSPNGETVFVVGRYQPPGNVSGEFADNVPLPLSGRVTLMQPKSKSVSSGNPSRRIVILRKTSETGESAKQTNLRPSANSDLRFQDKRQSHAIGDDWYRRF